MGATGCKNVGAGTLDSRLAPMMAPPETSADCAGRRHIGENLGPGRELVASTRARRGAWIEEIACSALAVGRGPHPKPRPRSEEMARGPHREHRLPRLQSAVEPTASPSDRGCERAMRAGPLMKTEEDGDHHHQPPRQTTLIGNLS